MARKSATDAAGNSGQLAKLLNLSIPQCYNLANSGTIPKPDNGVWDLTLCAHQYIKYLQGRAGEEKRDFAMERTRLTRLQADKVALEIAILQADVIPSDTVRDVLSGMIAAFRARLLALPSKLAAVALAADSFAAIDRQARDLIHEALQEIAGYSPDAFQTTAARAARLSRRLADSEPAAELADQSVGEPDPAPVRRGQRRTRPVSQRAGAVSSGDDGRPE
jgi:phage terminase Nu1 subunit (DNA packaging protein)